MRKEKDTKKGLSRISVYLKKHSFGLTFMFIFAIIATVFTVLAPNIMGKITTELYNGVSTKNFDWQKIGILIAALAGLYVVGQTFALFQNLIMGKIAAKVMESLRNDVDKKMHKLKLDYYDTRTNGEILSVITNDIDTINVAISQDITQIITQAITAIGILIMLLSINIWLALIAIAVVPIALVSSKGILKMSNKQYAKQQNLLGDLNGYIEEMYNGHLVTQSFNYQERAQEGFDKINEELQATSNKADSSSGLVTPITTVVNDIGYVIIAVLGCVFIIQGKMTIGQVQAMLQYTKRFSEPFTTIASMAGAIGAANAAAKRVFDILDAEEEIPDSVTEMVTSETKGDIEFSHVEFGYTPQMKLMNDVSFKASAGQKIAVVGPTGAGKTTLINLLMRFYEINGGTISVDGVSTKDMSREELRRKFGMVLQDTWLFEGTILDNLKYGGEEITDEMAYAAAKAAHADDFIKTLPNGYNMMLSKGAENISQGQRQLLTIARAMAANPQIMILDEATSNVDTHTEQLIQNALKVLMKGRTSFVIAHRLSTIKDADLILYMERGDIKEMGNHDQLMEQNGKYAELYYSQFA